MSSLVIGDGYIGRAVLEVCHHFDENVMLASRKDSYDNHIYLNLEDVREWEVPDGIDVAYFCAGISSRHKCEKDYLNCRIVNLINTIEIIHKLVSKNVFVVFLSSTEIFSGVEPFYNPSVQGSPFSKYGMLKWEAEKELINLKGCSVVRLTKVISKEVDLFEDWIGSLRAGNQIIAYDDVCISPVSLSYVSQSLVEIGRNRILGIIHLSGSSNLTYFQIAKIISNRLEVSDKLVARGKSDGHVQKFASLEMSGVPSSLFSPQSIDQVIDELLIDY